MASDRWACGAIPHVVRYALRLGIAAILQVDSLSPTWATFLIHKQNRISHVDLLTTVAVLLLCGLDSVPNWLCPVAIRDTGAFLRMRVGDSCPRQFQSTNFCRDKMRGTSIRSSRKEEVPHRISSSLCYQLSDRIAETHSTRRFLHERLQRCSLFLEGDLSALRACVFCIYIYIFVIAFPAP